MGTTSTPDLGPGSRLKASREAPLRRWRVAAADLIGEIASTAERIAAARTWGGERAARADRHERVLATIERSRYCLSIADLGRALGIRKQVAHELAHAAARAGYLDLEPNPQGRRILQALLTPRGRAELAGVRAAQSQWLAVLLNGLGDREMATVTHVLRVIRQRLEREAREQAERRRLQRPRRREPWP